MNKLGLKESSVQFNEQLHIYTIGERQLKGVTPLVNAVYHTYDGVDEEMLNSAAEAGKAYHKQYQFEALEGFESDTCLSQRTEEAKLGLVPQIAEFLVSDEQNIASAIDLVYTDNEGNIVLGDIKTTSTLHLDEWRLQLSVYKYLFELQTGREAKELYVAWVNKHSYLCQMIRINPLDKAEVERMLQAYADGEELIAKPEQKGLAVVKDYEGAMLEYLRLEAEIKAFKEKFNDVVLRTMQENGDKSYKTDRLSITRVLETSKKSFDSKKFKEDYPELFEKYQKESVTKEHLLIKSIA